MSRQVRSDQAEYSFQGKVALELELEGCLAVHQAEKRKGILTRGTRATARMHVPLEKERVKALRSTLNEFGFIQGRGMIKASF